jgi:exonuclease III
LGIPYGNAPFLTSAPEAITAAGEARGKQVVDMLAEAKAVLGEGLPISLTGDFNEPSNLDWTEAATKAELCPIAVQWPATNAVEAAGFVDTYRKLHPDPVKSRGLTWTPTTKISDPKDHHDRIDFVFVHAAERTNVNVSATQIIGESGEYADVVVSPYPSDHRAVVAEVEFVAVESTPP